MTPTEPIQPGSPEFLARFHEYRYSAFRLETLSRYGDAPGEDADLRAFLAGEQPPGNPDHEQWQRMVRALTHAGRSMQRVHVVAEPLSDYLRLELTWGYGPNVAAGEDIRIIDLAEGDPWPVDVPQDVDFWLFDSTELLTMIYAEDGTWLAAEPSTDPDRLAEACRVRDAALCHAIPWNDYIAARPELARHVPRAT